MAGHVPLEGCLNMRDLGGHPTADGRQVRSGCVFRSDEPCSLSDTDISVIEALGVKVVFDLRTEYERDERPTRLPSGVERIARTSVGEGGSQTLEDAILRGELPEPDDAAFTAIYVELFETLAPELRSILDLAVDAQDRPLLFHCAAGKDRTGIVASVLLGALGVAEDVILDDYELTSTLYTPRRMEALAPILRERGIAEDRIRPFLEARRPVLAGALAQLHREWGGLAGFVRARLGFVASDVSRLQAALLV